MLGKYDVELEELDEFGNVWDSSALFFTDDYDEAVKFAESVEVSHEKEQVAIWMWDDTESYVEDSWVVKEFSR